LIVRHVSYLFWAMWLKPRPDTNANSSFHHFRLPLSLS
jgi:hypothetical protein